MSLRSGHYTAFVRRRPVQELQKQVVKINRTQTCYDRKVAETGKWYYTSDSCTSEREFSEIKKCQAYLLFYELLPLVN